jgi:hypothetical protein
MLSEGSEKKEMIREREREQDKIARLVCAGVDAISSDGPN